MRLRELVGVVVMAMALAAAGCGGDESSQDPTNDTGGGEPRKGGILTLGSLGYIDSLNPFNYIESQATNAMIMIYPQLVQYAIDPEDEDNLVIEGDWAESWETSADGKDWTFTLKPGGKWTDGKPLTAEDAAFTINMTQKHAAGPTAVGAAALLHVESAEAIDDTTLVIHYAKPVGNVLAQLEQFFVLPKHQWEPLAQGNGKAIKTFRPEDNLAEHVTGGAYVIDSYEQKGRTVFKPNPDYYGTPSNAEAIVLQYYTNNDAMIADLKGGAIQWVDQVPFEAIDVLKEDDSIQVNEVPGAETTNITWNSNPYKPKNRELLDPEVKKALSMCVDRERMIEVVFDGYATLVESLPGHIVGEMENPNLGPLEYDCDAANQMLDELGYQRGSDGIRIAPATTGQYAQPAHPMRYEIVQPTSLDFNGERMFDIVKEGWDQLGVDVSLNVAGDAAAAFAVETGDPCDGTKNPPLGYDKFDIAMWDWIGYIDPDFMLSVVTRGQWCSWSDTGWINEEYDRLYLEQSTTVDQEERKEIVWEMQQMIYDNFVYTQLTNHEYVDAHSKAWAGIEPNLAAYSKKYYTAPHQVG
jgi:peptide/nickel transport system substrate-binding protein